ncbi:MAG: ABC transporter ATP-binding protein [Clostridia bacterium]|nr:ABC transporter ATP-binding protein [Clostridia bacterium]
METILKVNKLNKSFRGHHVIRDVSFEVYAGEVFGFLGPNGAGKTTTIKMIMGFVYPDSGEITICGHTLNKEYEEAMQCVGGIVESPELYKNLSGFTNLKMYGRLHPGVTDARIYEAVKLVGMEKRANEKVKKYSLGMKQRIGLAQGILHKPKLLILDEPTNGLDPAGIKELRTIIREMAAKDNTAVFVSSHLLSEMELMCDRVAIIDKGVIIGEKRVDELKTLGTGERYDYGVSDAEAALALLREQGLSAEKLSPKNGLEFITVKTEANGLPEITYKLLSAGISVYTVSREENSLEDAFINLTGGGNTIA